MNEATEGRLPEPVAEAWTAFLAGEALNAATVARLAGDVRNAASGCRLAADERVHRMLAALGAAEAEREPFVERALRRIAGEASRERFVSAVERRIGDRAPPLRARPAFGARWPVLARARRMAVVAACGFAAAAAWLLWTRAERPRVVEEPRPTSSIVRGEARVQSGTLSLGDLRLGAGEIAPIGPDLVAGDERACVHLSPGAALCLEGGTQIALAAIDSPERRVAVRSGKLAVTLTRQAPGTRFLVTTLHGAVTAQGTVFSVEVPAAGAPPLVRVSQGKVAVGERLLSAYHALIVGTGEVWRMSAEEAKEEWALARGASGEKWTMTAAPSALALRAEPAVGVDALVELADALRARGRLSDAVEIYRRLRRDHPERDDVVAALDALRTRPRVLSPVQDPLPVVYRLQCGGSHFVDAHGRTWERDRYYNPGTETFSTWQEIDASDVDLVYQTERYSRGPFAYRLPVEPGRYVVRLHFAEIYAGTVKANMRRFHVFLEGRKVLDNYDIAADVGPMTAVVKQFVVEVGDGNLDIEFGRVRQNPKVSGIEVFALAPGLEPPPAPAGPRVLPPLPLPPTDALYRVRAGGREYVDTQGRRWATDSFFNDTGEGYAARRPIEGTEDDGLYQSQRFQSPRRAQADHANLTYSFPVPAGRYLLRLHFAEIMAHQAGPGRRVFDVVAEGREILSRLDVFAEAGFARALVKEAVVEVTDGALDVQFRPLIEHAHVAGIEVLPAP